MIAVIFLGALVMLALVLLAVVGGRRPSADERGGFEQHPGVGGGWPGSSL